MKPDLSSQAIANLVKEVIATRDGATLFTARFMGVLQHYDLSLGDGAELHPIVGFSVPDFNFLKGTAGWARSCEQVAAFRPDGIVAWATEGEPDLAAVKASLSRWYGPKSE
ncbi:hypothetical protein G7054_g8165 [Neopestalotiopsis clavispora]|nr:hypothetical protein G7054_g8165 [Neopestalotiopsis clavispora]